MRGFLLQLKNILLEYKLSIKGGIKMKEKTASIIAAVILIVMGIIIAVVGAGALDLYFGIGCLVAGGVLVILNIISLAKSKQITFGQLFLSTALIVLGVCFIWTHYVSFTMLINLIVLLILGLGIALFAYGLFTVILSKKVAIGVVEIVLGIVVIVFTILYLNIPDFQKAFWIVTGIAIAAYGVLELISVLANKKLK